MSDGTAKQGRSVAREAYVTIRRSAIGQAEIGCITEPGASRAALLLAYDLNLIARCSTSICGKLL